MRRLLGSFLDVHRNRVRLEGDEIDGTPVVRVFVGPEGDVGTEVTVFNEFDSTQMVRVLREFLDFVQAGRQYTGDGGMSPEEFEDYLK